VELGNLAAKWDEWDEWDEWDGEVRAREDAGCVGADAAMAGRSC